MAVVVTADGPPQGGFGQLTVRGTINLDEYATGGVPVDRTTFSFPTSLDDLIVQATGGYVAAWDKEDGTVILYWQTGVDDTPLGEVDDTTDVSSVEFRFTANGR